MDLFNEFGIDIGYVVIGMAGVIFILFIMLIINMAKNGSIRKKYKKFMAGEDGKNLEKAILDKFSSVDILEAEVEELNKKVDNVSAKLISSYRKIGLVKYDAFKEIGGKLSFVLVLLTDEDNGFIINSMHSSREGCFTYAKEVVNGEAFVILSEEEQQALDEAKSNTGLDKFGDVE
ncbi:DUF4446 family protein [Eubacterium sp. MSJ-13]|uniref:DUF4446 family protein n=1 Tax=Eubacterium sp. MSJ-13 TaxID=2841513 RepID=UPI001C0F4633|nr:DUF4446 family protein [Eubacterium sp. MSJ-13]MBU5477709.1 DUF4446 family protein [Eubacterium sp. MSJ-13]